MKPIAYASLAALSAGLFVPAPHAYAAAQTAESLIHDGAPTWSNDAGWSFKLRGRVNYDVGWVERPSGVLRDDLGTQDELRRARLGFEAEVPGGIELKFEADFAGNAFEVTDATLSYAASGAVELTAGQHKTFSSIEELTSSRFTSFIERAAFTDAFGFERRVGASGTVKTGDILAQFGVFTDNIEDFEGRGDTPFGVDGRVVFMPKSGETQYHLGGSLHYSEDQVAPGATGRYRQRPQFHATDTRFVATPSFPIASEMSYGLEAAMIRGPLHAAGELHWLRASRADAGRDPTFFGGYGEIGYFLTGETRTYKSGKFDRTKPARPLGRGGAGALQVNFRYDRLDLNSGDIVGGTQDALLASLVWIPTARLRFTANAGHLMYEDAAIAAAGGDTDYSVDMVALRAQFDF